MFTITPRTRIQEGASWEDIQDGDCYETGYEISNSDGEIIYDFADEDTKNWYENLNKKEGENKMNKTNAVAKLNEEALTNTAADIIDIFEELLDELDITLPTNGEQTKKMKQEFSEKPTTSLRTKSSKG